MLPRAKADTHRFQRPRSDGATMADAVALQAQRAAATARAGGPPSTMRKKVRRPCVCPHGRLPPRPGG